jgi:hypothetical protein
MDHLPLKRIGAKGSLKAAITSPSILGVWTHFMGGRTLACLAQECPGCNAQMPRRWEGYLGILTAGDRKHIILAVTPGAAIGIADSAPDPNNLRGLILIAERLGVRANARLQARVEEADLSQVKLPAIPDLKAHLLHIWGLDQAHTSMDHPGYARHVKADFTTSTKTDDEDTIQ